MSFLGYFKMRVPSSGGVITAEKFSIGEGDEAQIVYSYRGSRYAAHELEEIGENTDCIQMDHSQYFMID